MIEASIKNQRKSLKNQHISPSRYASTAEFRINHTSMHGLSANPKKILYNAHYFLINFNLEESYD